MRRDYHQFWHCQLLKNDITLELLWNMTKQPIWLVSCFCMEAEKMDVDKNFVNDVKLNHTKMELTSSIAHILLSPLHPLWSHLQKKVLTPFPLSKITIRCTSKDFFFTCILSIHFPSEQNYCLIFFRFCRQAAKL